MSGADGKINLWKISRGSAPIPVFFYLLFVSLAAGFLLSNSLWDDMEVPSESFHWSSWDSRTCYPRRAFIQELTDDKGEGEQVPRSQETTDYFSFSFAYFLFYSVVCAGVAAIFCILASTRPQHNNDRWKIPAAARNRIKTAAAAAVSSLRSLLSVSSLCAACFYFYFIFSRAWSIGCLSLSYLLRYHKLFSIFRSNFIRQLTTSLSIPRFLSYL